MEDNDITKEDIDFINNLSKVELFPSGITNFKQLIKFVGDIAPNKEQDIKSSHICEGKFEFEIDSTDKVPRMYPNMNKFLIGLILGIAIAGGVAFYLNSMTNQFENKAANRESGSMITNSGPLILAPGTKLQEFREKESKDNASAVNYDFYDILQGKKPADSNQNKPKENQEKKSNNIFCRSRNI
jgi:hypothetical protein